MTLKRILTTSVVAFVIAGCGGGGGNTPTQNTGDNGGTPPPTTQNKKLTSGTVSDGYIAEANVLVDINTTTKGAYDSGDYNTTTNLNGNFDIPETITVPNGTIIYANGGKIISTGEDFNGTLKGVFDGQKESIVLSPVTTMVATLVEDKNITSEQAKEKVADALGIPKDKVTADPVTDDDALKAVQKVVAIAKVIQTDSNDSISEIIEDIAKELDDSNLTQAVQSATNDENLTKDAMETAKVVEEAIDNLQKDTNSSNTEIEKAIQEHVVEKAKEAVENEGNVTEALNEGKEKLTNNDFQDTVEAASCLTFDKIKGTNSDADSVITDLNLTAKSACEDNNVTIAWVNASSNIDKSTGAVTRANYDNNLSFVEANVTKNAQSITKPIFFTVLAKGQRPVAMPDIATVEEDSNVTIDVLANDTDDNKSELNVTIATDPTNGTATVSDNKIVYTPNANFNGTDILTYSLLDPYGAESNATVTITVTPKNDAPVLDDLPNLPSIPENSNATTITLHATDADVNDTITYSATSSNPAIATVNVSGDQLTVTPKPNANGDVNITVTATDSHGESDSKTVTLHITPVNDAPVLSDIQNVNVNEDASNLTINLQATDVDGDSLSYSAVSSDESMVSVSVNTNVLTLTFVPNANGQATITVTVSDGNGGTAEKTFTVNITPVNDAPVLNNIPNNPTIDEDAQPLHIELNATDADHDNLEFSATSSDTSIAQVSINGNILTITPQLNANGDVNITVTVTDHNGGSDSKTVTLHINPLNDEPVAINDTISVASNAVALIDVLANDTDIDSPRETLTVIAVTQPANGQTAIVENKVQFTPPSDFNGTVTFDYTIRDDQNATATATVTVDVAQYVTAMTNAINQVKNFDKENGDFDTLLSSLRSTLENADANETDAEVGLALIDLAETIDADIANFIEIDGSQASIDMLLHKDEGAQVALAIVGDLSEQTEASLQNVAANLKNIADKIDALLASNPNYEFRYKDFTLSSDDLKALSGALDLKAALLEYGAAYKTTKKEYVETQTANINGTSVEYQVYKADPKTVLNDPETLSLNGSAQNHFDTSKSELQRAINKLASVDTSKVKSDFREKINKLQDKLSDLNTSLNGGANFVIGDETKIYIDVSALFNESSAPTLATVLGKNWRYTADCQLINGEPAYNEELSKKLNKPMTLVTDSEHNNTFPIKLGIKPDQIPTGDSSHLIKIIKKIETRDGSYTGDDILDKMFGEIYALSNEETYQYNSLDDVNITYTIDYDSPTGNTPQSYSCEVIDVNLYNENWDSVDTGNNFLTVNIIDGNKCKLTFDTSVGINTGSISYEIVIKDSFGHRDHEYGWFAFGSQNNGGGDNGDQNGTNGGGDEADQNTTNMDINFERNITAGEYDSNNAIDIPMNTDLYSIEYHKDDSHEEYRVKQFDINATHIVRRVFENGTQQEVNTIPYTNSDNVIQISFNGNGDIDFEAKFVQLLDSDQLNNTLGLDIFQTGDIGYIEFEKDYNENKYSSDIWFNENAKNRLEQYIQQ